MWSFCLLFLPCALTLAIRRGRRWRQRCSPGYWLAVCQLGNMTEKIERERERAGDSAVSPALLFYSRSTPLCLPPPHLSVSPCQVSFSSVLALPRRELQRAAATCWQPPHTTEPWNLDLTTPPPEALPQCSLSLLSSILSPLNQFLLLVLLLPPIPKCFIFFSHTAKLSHLFLVPVFFCASRSRRLPVAGIPHHAAERNKSTKTGTSIFASRCDLL